MLSKLPETNPWLLNTKLVAKPDQLIKRRGKSGLLAINKTWPEAKEWVRERAGKLQKVETVEGYLRNFLVEPFVAHSQDTEYVPIAIWDDRKKLTGLQVLHQHQLSPRSMCLG